jgi:TonB family protein
VSEKLATLDADAANARLIHRIEPEYSAEIQANGEQGPVELEVRVGADGVVEAVTVVSGDPALANAALVAVRQWHYQPLVVSGRNTPFRTRVSLNFTPSAN